MASLTLDFDQKPRIDGDKIFAPLKNKWLKRTSFISLSYQMPVSEKYAYAAEQMAFEAAIFA